jgi:hypothetical protein
MAFFAKLTEEQKTSFFNATAGAGAGKLDARIRLLLAFHLP